jgi:hypothetical protein
MDFTLLDALGKVFSEDDGSWDKGMIKSMIILPMTICTRIQQYFSFAENHDTNRSTKFIKTISKIQDGNGCTGNGAWYSSIVLR